MKLVILFSCFQTETVEAVVERGFLELEDKDREDCEDEGFGTEDSSHWLNYWACLDKEEDVCDERGEDSVSEIGKGSEEDLLFDISMEEEDEVWE